MQYSLILPTIRISGFLIHSVDCFVRMYTSIITLELEAPLFAVKVMRGMSFNHRAFLSVFLQ